MELAVYNPAILDDETFIKGFVARRALAERLLDRLREVGPNDLAAHHLILGQRGMGKTSLLRRLAIGIRDDPKLSTVLLPLSFREEQYNVHNLRVFWLNCLDALGDWFEHSGEPDKADALDRDVARLSARPADPEGEDALGRLLDWARREGRRPLLLLDNLDIILNGLSKQQWALRRVLQKAGGIVVVGASAGWLEATMNREAAFYDFFQVTVLEPLAPDALIRCLRRLAEARGERGRPVRRLLVADPGRIRALHDLTGGNPRTLTLLYLLLEMDSGGDVLSDLERLLDQVSVLYKARVEDLAPQARVVLDAVALAWDPVIAAEVAGITGLAKTTVSTQLDRLQRDGLVQKVDIARSKRAAYQLGERFFNIWYLMRHGPRRQRARLRWLSAFLRGFYTPAQLRERAYALLGENGHGGDGLGHGQYLLALGDALQHPALQQALAAKAERAINDYLARSGKRLDQIGDLSDLPRPENAEDWDLHGQILHRHMGRLEEAEAAYRRALDLEPGFGRCWQHLGDLLRDRGRAEAADEAYLAAINAGWARYSWPLRAELLLRTGHFDDVEQTYRDVIAADPKEALAWASLAGLLANDAARWPEAETAYLRAIEIEPTMVTSQLGLFELLVQQGRIDEAEALLVATSAKAPQDARVWNKLGYVRLYFRDHISEAAAVYEKASAMAPDDIVLQSNRLAINLLRAGPELRDDAAFDAVACRHPEHGAALLRTIRALIQENIGDAADQFERALTFDPGEVLIIYQGFVLLILREAARRGFGERLLQTLAERGIADRHWPLHAAFDAYLHGEQRLSNVNPEVRGAARRIFAWLDAPRAGAGGTPST